LRVNASARIGGLEIVADGDGLSGRVGTAAVAVLADRVGLTAGLSRALEGRTTRRSAVDGGRVLRDLVVMLVDGGDAVSDLGSLRDQPELFGRVASGSTVARVIDAVGEHELAPHQRQGRALPPDHGPRMGLRPHLPLTSTARPGIDHYNRRRPHSSLADRPPISRVLNVPGYDS
jgi:hypothetical protein